jgi:hypothetical protein
VDSAGARAFNSFRYSSSEGPMHDYEILILNSDHHPLSFVEVMESSDAAAIRSAQRIAKGRDIEVWRDLDCVYKTPRHDRPAAA